MFNGLKTKYVKNSNGPSNALSVKYENEDFSVAMPNGKAIYAYLDNKKLPLGSGGLKNNIVVLRSVKNGAKITLPSGWTKDGTIIFASMQKQGQPSDYGGDHGYNSSGLTCCYVDNNLILHCYSHGHIGENLNLVIDGYADILLIKIK